MTGTFSPANLAVSVSASTRKVDSAIEEQLESIWEEKTLKAKEQGQILYNGMSYRLNSLEENGGRIRLDFGTLEYKVRDGLIAIPKYFEQPEDHYRRGCFSTATVKTSDGYYLMVELSGKSMNENKFELIGGIMETTITMRSGMDIFQSFYNELLEEAGIDNADIDECSLKAIYLETRTNVGFYFEVTTNTSAGELIKRFQNNQDQDIKQLHALTRVEYLKTLNNHPSPNKSFIAQFLLQI